MNSALNAAIDHDIYNYSHVNNHKARDKLLEIMEDLQNVHYLTESCIQWIKYLLGRKILLRLFPLDYILISESLPNFAFVKKISLKPNYRSDDSAVIMEMKCTVILLEDMVSGS